MQVVGEQAELGANGDSTVWTTVPVYIFVVLTVSGAVSQVAFLNQGLKRWIAVKALPMYNTSLIFFSTIYGGIFFKDYETMSTVGLVVFPFALSVIIGGVMMLARDSSADAANTNRRVQPYEPEDGKGEDGEGEPIPLPPVMGDINSLEPSSHSKKTKDGFSDLGVPDSSGSSNFKAAD